MEPTYRIIIKVLDIDNDNDDNTKSLDCLYLTIFGEDGSTGELILKQDNKIIKSNSNNEYELEGLNVGQVNRIRISHNDLSSKNRMNIETVTVLKEENLFKFTINKWLDTSTNIFYIETDKISKENESKSKIEKKNSNSSLKSTDVEKNESKSKIDKRDSIISLKNTDAVKNDNLDDLDDLDNKSIKKSFVSVRSNPKDEEPPLINKSKTSLNSKEKETIFSIDKQDDASRLSKKSQESKSLRSLSAQSNHSELNVKETEPVDLNTSKTSLKSASIHSKRSISSKSLAKSLTNENKQVDPLDKDFRKMSIHSTSSSNFIPVPKQESKSSHSSKQSQYSIKKSKISLRSNKSNNSKRSSSSKKETKSRNHSSSSNSSLNSTKKTVSHYSKNESITKTARKSQSRSSSRRSPTIRRSSTPTNTRKSITNKDSSRSRSSSRSTTRQKKTYSNASFESKASSKIPKSPIDHEEEEKSRSSSRSSYRSSSSASSSPAHSKKASNNNNNKSSTNLNKKSSHNNSIPSLHKSMDTTLHSSITESEILLSQSYFEDADRVVQEILLRSEESAANLSISINKNQKTNNFISNSSTTNKINSRKSQNTKSDYSSDSFSRQARMEKRIKYKPNINTEFHEESTHIELKRIKECITKETAKIIHPKRRDHYPYVFNDLTPYSDTRHVEYLLNSPLNNQPVGYFNRYTAMTIVEPWVAHRMEHTVGPLFAKTIRHTSLPRPQTHFPKSKDRPAAIEGSTLAPSFPKVVIKKPKGMNGPFYYDDIEIIRKELEKNIKNKNRIEDDRNRTINDYYRMNLDQSASNEKTWDCFRAYLENTPGSKKAIKEIIEKAKLTDSLS